MVTAVKSFRPAPVVDQAVARNGGGRGLSHRLAQIADRYSAIIADADSTLSDAEINLIRDVTNGWLAEPADQIAHLDMEVLDAININGADAKWGIDGPTLIGKIRGLSLAQKIRLVEDAEAWWAAQTDASRT